MFDDDGRYVQLIGIQNDVTDPVAADRSLRDERDRIRTSLDRAGRMIAARDQELADLRVLQRALTPSEPPPRRHFELASCFVAAEDGVAGDFYLVAAGPHDATIVAVGDVMGHGLEAARRATFVRTALRTCARFTDDPLRLLAMANHALIEHTGPTTEFVAAVCATYHPDEGRLVWAAAGHPPPVALGTGEPVGAPDRTGVPLGIETDLGAGAMEVPFGPEDGVLLFTDGLPEARPVDRRPAATRRWARSGCAISSAASAARRRATSCAGCARLPRATQAAASPTTSAWSPRGPRPDRSAARAALLVRRAARRPALTAQPPEPLSSCGAQRVGRP